MIRCSYVFADERPCRGHARRGLSFCRHHTSQALEERASRVTPPPVLDENSPRSQYTVYWRGFHAAIRDCDESEFDDVLANILTGLDQGVLSDRSAGRLLHTLVVRRRQLHHQRVYKQVVRLAEQHRAQPRQTGISAMEPQDLPSSVVREIMGLQNQNPG